MNKEKHFMVEDDIIANKDIEEASSGAERCMDEIFDRELNKDEKSKKVSKWI